MTQASESEQKMSEFLMTSDVARLLNKSEQSVRAYAREQRLVASIVTARGTRLFTREDVLRFKSSEMQKHKYRKGRSEHAAL